MPSLTVEEIDLEGPKAGEVLVEIKASGICHTDEFTLSGADPRACSRHLRSRRRRHRRRRRPGRDRPQEGGTTLSRSTHRSAGRAVVPLPQDEPLHRDPRHAGQGRDAGRHPRFSIGGEKIHHYMGCSTFSHHTVHPEIALAKIREDAPFDKVCYIGCGVTTRASAPSSTRRRWSRAPTSSSSASAASASTSSRARGWSART